AWVRFGLELYHRSESTLNHGRQVPTSLSSSKKRSAMALSGKSVLYEKPTELKMMASGFCSLGNMCSMPQRIWQEVVFGLAFQFSGCAACKRPGQSRLMWSENRFFTFVVLPT